MSLKFAVPVAIATACLSLAGNLYAVPYNEVGDAGDLPSTAQAIAGPANTTLDSISGSLTLTNGISDSDMFRLFITNPATFSASTVGFIQGVNSFDSQIFLFNAAGLGVVGNDDNAVNGGSQAAIPAGSFNGPAGEYFLLISGSGRYAASVGGLIFPNYTDNVTDPTTTVGPTGPGGGSPVTGYTGSSNEGGAYRVALTGAQFVVVPEPSSLAFAFVGAAGLALVQRARRRG